MRRRHVLAVALAAATLTLTAAPAASAHQLTPRWQERPTGTDEQFRGLAPVNRDVAWLAGTHGTVLRTLDGGRHWQDVSPADASDLEFRDIEAFGRRTAVALSIGEGDASRVYVTRDAGHSWHVGFTNSEPAAFYDCMTFFDPRHGIAMSDPVDGKFWIIATADGGDSWHVVDPAGMPPALPDEFGFAASGTCLVSSGPRDAWLATGGAAARVLHTRDRGRTWTAIDTPIRSGPTAGIYSLAFRDPRHGLAVGGDFTTPADAPDALATTHDGGRTYALAAHPPNQYRSGVAWVAGPVALTVGPTGSDVSYDAGRSWHAFDGDSLDAVACTRDLACWGSGADGRATVLAWHR